MELTQRQALVWFGAAFGCVALIVLFRLSAFGIWDPWELTAADTAQSLLEGHAQLGEPPLRSWMVAAGFRLFGDHEWAGRLPIALAGLIAVGAAFSLVAWFAGLRAGVYAAIVTGTTPLFLLNARQMMGAAPIFAAQGLVALCAAALVFRPLLRDGEGKQYEQRRNVATLVWAVALVGSMLLAILAGGALVAVVPPLLGVAAAAIADGIMWSPGRDLRRARAAYGVTALAIALAVRVGIAIFVDASEYSAWLGGMPRGRSAPSFDKTLEDVFHAFAPWSGILPVALGALLLRARRNDAEASSEAPSEVSALGLILVVWAATAYAATVIFSARYGSTTYPAVIALAAAVALLLRRIEVDGDASWTTAIVTVLFVTLIVRDYALYPGSPVDALALEQVTYPEVFNPKIMWAVFIGLFALIAFLTQAIPPQSDATIDFKAPYRLLRSQWDRGLGFKIWIGYLGVILVAAVLFGLVCLVAADKIGLTSIVAKWGKRAMVLPIAVALAVAAGQGVFFLVRKLGTWRFAPLLVAGVACGVYTSQVYLPQLSAHFSPREVYDRYNALANGAPLGEYRVGGRAAAYYTHSEPREINTQQQLLEYLGAEELRFATFPADELAGIDRAFRQRAHRHLFIADARSARVVLAANQPLEGVQDENFLARYVLSSPPDMEHQVGCRFEDKIELIGWSADLPGGDFVGAGERFTITWYYRALRAVGGSWKAFVHIDGHGNRLNGDHDPVEEKYPPRYWDEGDVIVDVQQFNVPSNYRPGAYEVMMGFFSGNTRMDVVDGPHDNDKRCRAGELMVR